MTDQREMFNALTCDPFDLIERGSEVLSDKARWPQRLVEIYDLLFAYAKRQGLDDNVAANDATCRTILIADYLGGSVVYLPRGDALRIAVRDSEVYRRHNGRNTEQLARELGMTTTKFYELLARERKRRARKFQGQLFANTIDSHVAEKIEQPTNRDSHR